MGKLGKILKIVLVFAIISVLGLLAVNMIKQEHKELEELQKTDAFNSVYQVSSDVRTHVPGESNGFSENGGLYSYSLYYIESAGYIQITVRYNEKHMDDIKANYPDFDMNTIHYTLTDDKGNTYAPTVVDKASKFHYEYFKLEFTGVDFKDTALKLNMVIDVLSDVVGEKNSVVIHKAGQTSIPYEVK
jgi:hypothetical protein